MYISIPFLWYIEAKFGPYLLFTHVPKPFGSVGIHSLARVDVSVQKFFFDLLPFSCFSFGHKPKVNVMTM